MTAGTQPPEGLEPTGMLKPPTGHEQTEVKAEGLAHPEPIPMKLLTLDESDILRAERAFCFHDQLPDWFMIGLNNHALQFSKFLILNCPPSKERSQALGNVQQVVMWAIASHQNKAS